MQHVLKNNLQRDDVLDDHLYNVLPPPSYGFEAGTHYQKMIVPVTMDSFTLADDGIPVYDLVKNIVMSTHGLEHVGENVGGPVYGPQPKNENNPPPRRQHHSNRRRKEKNQNSWNWGPAGATRVGREGRTDKSKREVKNERNYFQDDREKSNKDRSGSADAQKNNTYMSLSNLDLENN